MSAIAELAFKYAQGLTDPRLGQAKPLGAASKAQSLGHDQEDPERVPAVPADIRHATGVLLYRLE